MKNAVQTMLVDGVNKLAQDVLIQSLLSWTSKSADRPSNAVTGVQPRIISKQAELSAAIAPAADAAGVDAYMLSVATAILGGNGLLLLAGSDANNAAQAAAVLLASNNSCRVAVASTMFGQSDLLSAPCSRVMASDAHAPACRLGEFLREAMSREHVSVVILQGCNRAPLENVLLELLEIKSQSGIERSVEWVDVGGEVQTVRIDRRIAFVGTLTGGPSTFMIPKIMESRIPILWADRQVSPIDETLRPSMQEPTLVAFTHWRSLGNNDVPTAVAPIKTFRSQTATPSSALHLTDYVRRVAAAIGDDDVGVAEAIAALVSGRASKDAQQSIGDSMSAKAKKTFTSSVVSSDAVTRTYCEGSSRT
jgi:hypothetical protein